MKYAPLLIGLTFFPYGTLIPQPAGNPDDSPYLGDRESVYDAKANPAQTLGTVSYDPMGPMQPTPSDVLTAQPSGASPLPR